MRVENLSEGCLDSQAKSESRGSSCFGTGLIRLLKIGTSAGLAVLVRDFVTSPPLMIQPIAGDYICLWELIWPMRIENLANTIQDAPKVDSEVKLDQIFTFGEQDSWFSWSSCTLIADLGSFEYGVRTTDVTKWAASWFSSKSDLSDSLFVIQR